MFDVQWPPHITTDDAQALNELASAGVGEGDFDGDDHGVPADLVDLHIDLETHGGTPGELQAWAKAEQ